MLVLSRHKGESIMIGDFIVTVVSIHGGKVRLGVQAPLDTPVFRREIYDKIKRAESAGEHTDSQQGTEGA